MKITFILPALNLSGGTRVVAIYADRLAARGHDVLVIAPRQQPQTFRHRFASLLKHGRWPAYAPYDDTHFRKIQADVRILNSHKLVSESDIPDGDIVIATWWETAEWVWNLSGKKGAKVHLIQDHEIFEYLPVQRAKSVYQLPLKKIAVSQWLVGIIHEKYGIQGCVLVPNSVDFDQFFAEARGRQNFPTVGFLYTTAPRKNIALAVEVIALVKSKIPELKVTAFGSSKPNQDIPLPDWVKFVHCPQQNKIREIYASCDAWLFPSRSEGFGLPILEAMACRTPVIATPAGAAPELLSSGGGILVEEATPQAMADAIESLFSMNDEQWLQLSDSALATARQYSWKDATDRFEEALVKVLEESKKNSLHA